MPTVEGLVTGMGAAVQHQLCAVVDGERARELRHPDVVADDGGDRDAAVFEDEQVIAAVEVVLLHRGAKLREMQLVEMANGFAATVRSNLGYVVAVDAASRHAVDDRGPELASQRVEPVKGWSVQGLGEEMQVVEAGFRVVDARQLRQHHEVVTSSLESNPDLLGDTIEVAVAFGNRRGDGNVDLAGENPESGHRVPPVPARAHSSVQYSPMARRQRSSLSMFSTMDLSPRATTMPARTSINASVATYDWKKLGLRTGAMRTSFE